MTGTIVEALPSALYKVELPDGRHIVAHVAQKMRLTYVRVLPGDRVSLEVSPYDKSRARIVEKLP
jgi:translation initiation factor IF-1